MPPAQKNLEGASLHQFPKESKNKTMIRRNILLLLFTLLGIGTTWADDIPYRQQMRELYRQLPVHENDIVFLGNSITDFGLWAEFFGGPSLQMPSATSSGQTRPEIVNRGIQGIESPEVLEHLALIGEGHPRKLFLMIGINDFEHPQTVVPSIRKMVTLIQERSPQTQIYVQSILPCNIEKRKTTPTTLNPQIEALCDELGVTYIDVFKAMAGNGTAMPSNMTDDQLHPNILGYRVWCNAIKEYVGNEVAIDQKATGYTRPITRVNMFKTIPGMYQLLPVQDGDILHVGDYQVMTAEWGELMGMASFKNRGLGGGHGWNMTLDEFNAGYTSFVKGKPSKVFFHCGKRDLDDNTANVLAVFAKYKTAVANILKAAPDADIYLESLVPNASAAVNTKSIAPFNAMIREYVEASGNERLHFVDLYAALEEDGVLAPRYQGANTEQSKGINGRAYVRWANLLAEYVDGAKPIAMMSDAKAALNEAMWDALNLVWAGNEGEIVRLADEAKELMAKSSADPSEGGEMDEEYAALATKLSALVKELKYPRISNDAASYWYTLRDKRGGKYAASNGAGKGMTGQASIAANGSSYWKFVERKDGTLNIINYHDGSYVSNTAPYNQQLTTSAKSPSAGWTITDAGSDYFILSNGDVQLHQSTGANVLNWGGGSKMDDAGCLYSIQLIEGLPNPDEVTYDYIGVTPGKTYTLTNVQRDGTTRALYVDGGQLLIGKAGQSAESYGDKAAFKVEGHEGQVAFQNVSSNGYLIFRGNGNGHNGDAGVMADFTAPYCLWNIGKSSNLDDGYFLYSVRKDGSTPGSLIIMSATGIFDAYNSTEGYTDKFSNVFRFAEVEGAVVSIHDVTLNNRREQESRGTADIYDLSGRRQRHETGIIISDGQKFLR